MIKFGNKTSTVEFCPELPVFQGFSFKVKLDRTLHLYKVKFKKGSERKHLTKVFNMAPDNVAQFICNAESVFS